MPGRGIRSGEGTAMSGDGSQFEYPDQAGYPDGMGTLHEGTEDVADGDGDGGDGDSHDDAFVAGLDHFAMQDEEDVDEDV